MDDDQWGRVTPAEVGFSDDLEENFEIARLAGTLPNLHGVVAARHGRIFFERYLPGPDVGMGRPLGVVRFGPDSLHDMRSVTKSVVGLLYGIALEAGLVPGPEANLLEQFPEYPDLANDPARRLLTIRHALTMTLGIEWDELGFPYGDPRNGETAMNAATDRYRHVLARPIVGAPSQRWIYTGGATVLLARLIARGTGQSLQDFAHRALFAPLGIMLTEWRLGTDGEPLAASGLRMTPRDMAKLGTTILHKGVWNGARVIPESWLVASFAPAVSMPDGRRYGYHWYLGMTLMDDGAGGARREATISARGNGGQRLFLLPGLDLAVAVTAGNYGVPGQDHPPTAVLRDVLLPAFRCS
jgi:CubicO group peptidase (beta-lactamase class C family)